jgi:hypothetical protein
VLEYGLKADTPQDKLRNFMNCLYNKTKDMDTSYIGTPKENTEVSLAPAKVGTEPALITFESVRKRTINVLALQKKALNL